MKLRALCMLAFTSLSSPRELHAQNDDWRPIERREFCVTAGSIDHTADRMIIDDPEVRATMRTATPQFAELRFTYLGPSTRTVRLGSGEVRRQIGLKLRAQDTCNVVYAMWHIERDTNIALAIKRNPGKHTHAECGDRGYIHTTRVKMPPVTAGSAHTLRATLRGNQVEIHADDRLVLKKGFDPADLDFDGPVGMRTDNARFRFQYFVGRADLGPLSKPLDMSLNPCH